MRNGSKILGGGGGGSHSKQSSFSASACKNIQILGSVIAKIDLIYSMCKQKLWCKNEKLYSI